MVNNHFNSARNLFSAILKLESLEDCEKFFSDICTVKEVLDMSLRLKVAKELKDGKSYQDISKETGASTTTISRVNRCLVYGSGGYREMLERLEEEE